MAISAELARVREKTLWLLSQVPVRFWNLRVHNFYSPIGWHFGHIGMTEEFWTCGKAMGRPARDDRLCFLFANIPENPKDNRVHLPSHEEVAGYLATTRVQTLDALHHAALNSQNPLLADGYAWEFALQHECQHQETIAELLQLIRWQESRQQTGNSSLEQDSLAELFPRRTTMAPHAEVCPRPTATSILPASAMISIPGGTCVLGSDDRHGYDNEKRAHVVETPPFEMEEHPVTVSDWLRFMGAGGYSQAQWWTEAGWQWRTRHGITHPEYWLVGEEGWLYCSVDRIRPMDPAEPVTALSWYEADAYARWSGKRLPTETEWEFAAAYDPVMLKARRYPWGDDLVSSGVEDGEMRAWAPRSVHASGGRNALGLMQMAGAVWEWTSSLFLPYAGFEAFPYDGYSKEHMDGNHLVCRGGSWATDRRIMRASFRNWYVPSYRQGFLGMRCAR